MEKGLSVFWVFCMERVEKRKAILGNGSYQDWLSIISSQVISYLEPIKVKDPVERGFQHLSLASMIMKPSANSWFQQPEILEALLLLPRLCTCQIFQRKKTCSKQSFLNKKPYNSNYVFSLFELMKFF